jgi:hypothetical protein
LYQRDKVAQAVVSLLDLMGVGVVSNDGKTIRAGRQARPAPFQLTESDVRALIAQGEADAAASARDDTGPFSFEDLFRAVSPALPRVSVQDLAAAYSAAYEEHPDDLVPQAVGFKKAGAIKEYPADVIKSVSPATLAFLESHYDEIAKSLATLGKAGDADEEDDDKR